mmetsp:Transcript_19435/g.49673  ORF Transcript_19435/g.49673 Transcript_19435/m.49673 type:complete len:84 (+) Transcript_19435:210-461(+)
MHASMQVTSGTLRNVHTRTQYPKATSDAHGSPRCESNSKSTELIGYGGDRGAFGRCTKSSSSTASRLFRGSSTDPQRRRMLGW